ncbi:glycosyl transferase family 2 [Halanaerobium saccharolyticum]|uniref:Glycosyl transferase family 2 n=1 Tax=Halanaerobium saccharolyticum TaxID=43595 RepID=A0A4V6PTS0_9FIRM|nr:glycosyltransferase family 2 protein [Halanaerobium saccharolyticum]TDO95232.1 glycosyl transferase family 2 [Halanaerobium saccharolyticum]
MLTIGIPTYNRAQIVEEHLRYYIKNDLPDWVKILIIDNNSSDETYKNLLEISKIFKNIEVYKNKSNLGFQGNYLELFKKCDTDYLLLTSDEDPVIIRKLSKLKNFLDKNQPTLISSQFYLKGEAENENLYRGSIETREIRPNEFHNSSFYISGLVYNINNSLKIIKKIENYLKNPNQIYPQILLASQLIAKYKCFWWSETLVEKAYQLDSEIKGETGEMYYHISERWKQHKLFVDFLKDMIALAKDKNQKKRIEMMLKIQEEMFIYRLRHAINQERPDLLSGFDRGAVKLYSKHLK